MPQMEFTVDIVQLQERLTWTIEQTEDQGKDATLLIDCLTAIMELKRALAYKAIVMQGNPKG